MEFSTFNKKNEIIFYRKDNPNAVRVMTNVYNACIDGPTVTRTFEKQNVYLAEYPKYLFCMEKHGNAVSELSWGRSNILYPGLRGFSSRSITLL